MIFSYKIMHYDLYHLKNVKGKFSKFGLTTVLVPAGDISNGKYLYKQPS